MYFLSDGKRYVMENPLRRGDYVSTTSPLQAKEFSFKQARSLQQSKKKSLGWVKSYEMIDSLTGEKNNVNLNYQGKGEVYIGKNDIDIDFENETIKSILNEIDAIENTSGWDMKQLCAFEDKLRIALSKYDSAISDIEHALQKYRTDNNDRKPQAHKMAKIGYLLDEIRNKHKDIKQCMRYIQIMKSAIENNYTFEKLRNELVNAKKDEYKGRTEYYKTALEILK